MTLYKNFEFESQGDLIAGYEWYIDNPKVVVYLIHGIGEHAGRYDRVAEAFNSKGIALVAMDLRGHGRSPGKRGHIGKRSVVRKDIDNLIKWTQKKYPSIPLIHYGHSLGGNISLDYRLRGELSSVPKGYLITSPWVKLVRPIPSALYGFVKVASKIFPKMAIAQNIENHMLGDVKLIEKEEHIDLRHQKISLLTAVEGFDIAEELMNNQVNDMYGGGKKQMLLMHGECDPICDVNGSRAIAKNYGEICQYVEWEDYLHELHNGTSEKSSEPITDKMTSWIIELVDKQ